MIDFEALIKELQFRAVRSSGAGGQHVNKVSSKVELYWNLHESSVLDDDQKQRLERKLANRLTKENVLILQNSESRRQHKNKELVVEQFKFLLEEALKKKKKRLTTKIPKKVKQKRLANKKQHSEKKALRKPPEI